MTTRWRAAATAAAGIAVAASCWLHPVVSAPAAWTFARAAGVAALVLAAQVGLGRGALRLVAPAMLTRPGATGHALALGVGAHALLLFPLFALGACDRQGALGVLGVVVAAGGAGWWRARSAVASSSPSAGHAPVPAVPPLLVAAVAALLLPAVFDALAPAADTDELSYLLALPRVLLRDGGLPVSVLLPEAGRPLPVQLVAVGTMALGGPGVGGEAACRLWHLGLVGVLLGTVYALVSARGGRGWVPVLALAGSWSVVREAGLAYNDLPAALWLTCAADALLTRRWRLMAVHAGLAFACKYTAAPVCAGLFAIAAWDVVTTSAAGARAAELRRLGVALGLAALPVVPWWARNAALGMHPLFPFAGWPPVPGLDFVFVYPERYGLGHAWADALLLPFNVLFRAEPNSMVFYGRLSLLWLGLLAVPALRLSRNDPSDFAQSEAGGNGGGVARGDVARRLLVLVVLGFVGWALGAQVLRYLLPTLGVAALLLGTARLPRAAWLVLLLGSLPTNVGPAWTRAAAEAKVVTGKEDADAYLERELPAWPALRYARAWIPVDEPVALLACWGGYYVDQPYVLGSVEDHVPTRYWLALHGDEALHALWAQGVRWLVVGDLPTVRKSYSFLDDGTFRAQFKEPAAKLDRLLLRDARRVYFASHTAIWRLDSPPAPD